MTLNEQQTELLKTIMQDKFSKGAFSGMIFNRVVQVQDQVANEDGYVSPEETQNIVDVAVSTALDVRLRLHELSNTVAE